MGQETEKLRVLLLALAYPDVRSDDNIYTDLVGALAREGVDVQVVAPSVDDRVGVHLEGGVPVLRVRSGRLLNVGLVRKGAENLLLPFRFGSAILRQLGDWRADWIVVPTPPITLTPLVERLKRRWGSHAYLILRDIFPQNAVDLEIMGGGLAHGYFRRLEERTYAASDCIGCMSPANASFVLRHNPHVRREKLVQFPNWIADAAVQPLPRDPLAARGAWGAAAEDFVCVFGGNLGRPQRADFILDIAEATRDDPTIQFVLVGDGTERRRLEASAMRRGLDTVRFIPRLQRDKYQSLVASADVGLITLHEGFTIPNIPSRLLGYWAAGIPVLAATDSATDLGEAFLTRHDAGIHVPMGDIDAAVAALRELRSHPHRARQLGENGRAAVLQAYTATHAAKRLLAHMKEAGA